MQVEINEVGGVCFSLNQAIYFPQYAWNEVNIHITVLERDIETVKWAFSVRLEIQRKDN